VDIRPGCISWDHTSRGTLDRSGLSTRIRERGERLFGVNQGRIVQLWNDIREGTVALGSLVAYIVASPFDGIDNTVEDDVTDALQGKSGTWAFG